MNNRRAPPSLKRKLGPLPKPTLRTAHDVRHLAVCDHCKQLGDRRNMVDAQSPSGVYSVFHGRCFVAHRGPLALLALPRETTARLTLGDLGPDDMKALVEHWHNKK